MKISLVIGYPWARPLTRCLYLWVVQGRRHRGTERNIPPHTHSLQKSFLLIV